MHGGGGDTDGFASATFSGLLSALAGLGSPSLAAQVKSLFAAQAMEAQLHKAICPRPCTLLGWQDHQLGCQPELCSFTHLLRVCKGTGRRITEAPLL